jgi:signal transduction histidine kinase
VKTGTGGTAERVPRQPSVSSGLWGTVLLWLAGMLAVAVATGVTFLITLGQLDDAATRWVPLDRLNDRMRETAGEAQTSLRATLVTVSEVQRQNYQDAVDRLDGQLDDAMGLVGDDPQVRRSLDNQRLTFHNWVSSVAEPALADMTTDPSAAYARATNQQSLQLADRFSQANDDTENRIAVRRATVRKQLDEFLRAMLFVVGGVVLFAILAGLYRAQRLRNALVSPLRDIQDTVRRLGDGDLDARASTEGFVEVRAVAEAVNALADENQRLSARQTRRIERERQGRRMAASLHEHLELTRILTMAGAAIGESLHAGRVVFRLTDDDGFGPPVLEWRGPGVPQLDGRVEVSLPRTHPLVAPLFEGRVGAVTDDDSFLGPETRKILDGIGTKSALVVPVLAGDVIVALVAVHELSETRTWTPGEIELVQVIADELGSAIRHAQLYEAERSMVEQLRELDEVKSDFVSSVSHELRTPLTSVMGYIEMLRDRDAGPLTAEQDRMLDVVERNTERLLALIEDLLALARIESGRFKVVPAPLELPPLVDEAIDAFRPELAKRELRLLIDVPPGLPPVMGDARQLERVLLNLLSNAVKFTPPGGQIRVTLAPRVRSVVLEVADTGLGIPVEEQDKLFTRFFRSSTSQDHSVPGTGLGLMIVKAVVDSHGGSIVVRSSAGYGTAVTVTLPAVPATARVEELSR